jgi:hemoglobin-like flavoprotein
MDSASIARSIELVAERCGDPVALVYQRLFAERPDLRALFVRDRRDLVKGQMLNTVLETITDFVGDCHYAPAMIECELVNHEGLGVPPEIFAAFFRTVMQTFKDVLKEDWTEAIDRAWSEMLGELALVTDRQIAALDVSPG